MGTDIQTFPEPKSQMAAMSGMIWLHALRSYRDSLMQGCTVFAN